MTLLIGPKKSLPSTSLKEKQNGFKFQKPKLSQQKETLIHKVVDGTNTTVENSVVANTKVKPNSTNANKLLVDKPKSGNLLSSKLASKTTSIPEMSGDKYEVVADSVSEFSEKAGNKFEEQITMLQQAIDGTGELKDQMVNILTFLDDNPQYKDNVSPQDVAVFVAACRKVAGITVQEKTTRKTKTTKTTAEVAEVLSDLADLDFEI